MNILYIAHRLPYPPNKGDKIRSFHQIRYLSSKHRVSLACLIDEREDLRHIEPLKGYCTTIDAVYTNKNFARLKAVTMMLGDKPLSVAFFHSRRLQKKIARRIRNEKFDKIIIFSSAMAEYVRDVPDIPKVIDFVDLDSEKWRVYADYQLGAASWTYGLEARRLARYEEEVASAFDHSIFVSQAEASVFQQRVNSRRVSVIPNGVDLDYFGSNNRDRLCTDLPVIVFAGTMDYFPNVDAVRYFCNEIFPLILNAFPGVQFYIVGRNPTRVVRELNCQRRVIVTGAVPDVRPFLAKSSVAIAPFRIARGVQNKILEAMAMSLPVVGTSLAFQGIQATPADGIRIADDPKAFAQDVAKLLKDHDLYLQCSRQVRKYVEREHRWQDHGTRLESILYEIN
jgi:sugar transferase (PEP-CTERM/EpsH1 system associated)